MYPTLRKKVEEDITTIKHISPLLGVFNFKVYDRTRVDDYIDVNMKIIRVSLVR
jgi:hypothetical protein